MNRVSVFFTILMGLIIGVGCKSAPKPKPEKPVYVEAEQKVELPPPPPVVAVPVAQPVPGQMRPMSPLAGLSQEAIDKARESASEEPFEVIDRANAQAQASPAPDGFYNAIQRYDFMPGVLYQVYTAPLKITAIQFAPGEKVTSVALGDTVRWVLGRTTSGSGDEERELVLIKPVRAWLGTNMTVTTDARVYQIELHSYKETYMAAVSWNYPRNLVQQFASRAKVDGRGAAELSDESGSSMPVNGSVRDLNFDYGFVVSNPSKPPSWMPRRVFDDGTKTYVHFPRSVKMREAPALFVLSKDGQTQIVNYRVKGDYFIVDRMFDLAQLRLGEKNPITVGIERFSEGGEND